MAQLRDIIEFPTVIFRYFSRPPLPPGQNAKTAFPRIVPMCALADAGIGFLVKNQYGYPRDEPRRRDLSPETSRKPQICPTNDQNYIKLRLPPPSPRLPSVYPQNKSHRQGSVSVWLAVTLARRTGPSQPSSRWRDPGPTLIVSGTSSSAEISQAQSHPYMIPI